MSSWREIVQHVNGDGINLYDLCLQQSPRPRSGVDISADRGDRSRLCQCLEDRGSTYIARVEYSNRALQCLDRLRPQQTMGIGNHA
jgi:hypothetical protein